MFSWTSEKFLRLHLKVGTALDVTVDNKPTDNPDEHNVPWKRVPARIAPLGSQHTSSTPKVYITSDCKSLCSESPVS